VAESITDQVVMKSGTGELFISDGYRHREMADTGTGKCFGEDALDQTVPNLGCVRDVRFASLN
jgi:hypothetical protein